MERKPPKRRVCACGKFTKYNKYSSIQPDKCPKCILLNLTSGDAKAVRNGLYSKKATKSTGKKKKSTRKPKTDHKKLTDALDKAWSILVKLEGNNECAVCRKTKSLNSHHIYSRAKQTVRWDTINGICLCVGHHIGNKFSAHKTSASFIDWLRDKKGNKFMDELRLKSNGTADYHDFELQIMLDELNKRIKSYE